MAQPTDWLGPFIEGEVREVVAWKRNVETTPEVKAERDDRFSHDGSNLRSLIIPSTFPSDAKVQISKILTTEDPVTMFVTDGFTRVKAKLSESAVASLEAGLDEKINVDMKGDVLTIREATVESTPYGPSDGFIRLAIEDLEYLFHLRKPLGQPGPIEDRNEAGRLIKEIEKLLLKPYTLTETPREWPPGSLSVASKFGASRNCEEIHQLDIDETPKSQQSVGVSQHSSPIVLDQSPSTQRALATQIPTRRKLSGPTLAKDGFEIEDGVNLSRPIGPGLRETNRHVPNSTKEHTVAANGPGAKILSLLGKRKAEAPPEPAHRLQAQVPPLVLAAPEDSREDSASRPDLVPEPVHPTPSAPVAEQHTSPKQRIPRDYRRRKISRDQQRLLDWPSSWLPSLPRQQFPHPNVPIQLLNRWKGQVASEAKNTTRPKLSPVDAEPPAVVQVQSAANHVDVHTPDSSSSDTSSDDEEFPWSPSPSQKRPPLPPDSTMDSNSRPSTADKQTKVPPNMSDEAESRAPSTQETQTKLLPDNNTAFVETAIPPQAENGPPIAHKRPHAGLDQTSTSMQCLPPRQFLSHVQPYSHYKGNRDEPFRTGDDKGASEKQPTGSKPTTGPAKDARKHGTDQRHGTSGSDQQSPPNLPPESSAAAVRTPVPLPQKPDWIPRSGSRPSPTGRLSTRPLPALDGNRSRPSTSEGTRPEPPPVSSNATFMKPSPRAIKRPRESPDSTSAILVKGTQLRKSGDDDMEMEVPRSLGQDPVVEHRLRRSEHFKAAQRREWIKKNYIPDSGTRFGFYSAYKKAHPKDNIRLSDFVEAIEDVYPNEDGSPTKGAKSRSPKAADNVVPPSHVPPTATADVDGAVTTRPEIPIKSNMTTTTPSPSGQSRRVLPWTNGTKSTSGSNEGTRSTKAPSTSVFATFHRPSSKRFSHETASESEMHAEKANPPDPSKELNEHPSTADRTIPHSSSHTVAQVVTPTPNGDSSSHAHRPAPPSDINRVPETLQADPATSTTNYSRMRVYYDDIALAVEKESMAMKDAIEEAKRMEEARSNDAAPSVFTEFAGAWKSIKAGGAFAANKSTSTQRKAGSSRLDVLSWDL